MDNRTFVAQGLRMVLEGHRIAQTITPEQYRHALYVLDTAPEDDVIVSMTELMEEIADVLAALNAMERRQQ